MTYQKISSASHKKIKIAPWVWFFFDTKNSRSSKSGLRANTKQRLALSEAVNVYKFISHFWDYLLRNYIPARD